MKRWGFLIGCSIIASLLAGGWSVNTGSTGRGRDLNKIVAYADAHMEDGWRLTIRVSGTAGEYRDAGEVEQLGATIVRALGSNGTGSLELSGTTPVFRLQADTPDLGHISIMVAGSDSQASRFVIVRLDTNNNIDQHQLADWQARAQTAFHETGLQPAWNFIAQGGLRSGSWDPESKFNPESAAAKVAKAFDATLKERYTDSGTLSVSYDAPSLQTSIQSGSHRISLQTAIHQDSISGGWRMTIGTPVITTEY